MCGPAARAVYIAGDSHVANAAPSSEHSNSESISFALKVNVALVDGVELGGVVSMVVFGGTATVHTYSTGVSSARPYVAFFAATVNVCSPSTRPLYVFRDSQSDAPRPSISQKNSTSGLVGRELERRVDELLGSAGKVTSVVSGGASTVHS